MGEGGRSIIIGSVNADRMPFAGGSVYAMTKAAVAGFTRGLARDLAPRGITVNNVQPGPTETDMNPVDGAFSKLNQGSIAVGRGRCVTRQYAAVSRARIYLFLPEHLTTLGDLEAGTWKSTTQNSKRSWAA